MQHQALRYRTYARLLLRDVIHGAQQLVRSKRTKRQIVVTVTRPSFAASHRYLIRLRTARHAERREWRRAVMTTAMLIGGTVGLIGAGIQLQAMQPSSTAITQANAAAVRASEAATPKALSHSVPVRLEIADVGINTDLIQLGTNSDGTMETPTAYDIAGWYKYSPSPGEIGPAVVTGHVDNYQGPAVFFRLKELQPGQKIAVTRADGSVAIFAVTKLEQFDQDHFPTEAVYGNTDDAQLRLITCGGAFNQLTGKYTQNTVVFATIIPPVGETIDT